MRDCERGLDSDLPVLVIQGLVALVTQAEPNRNFSPAGGGSSFSQIGRDAARSRLPFLVGPGYSVK